MVTLITTGVRSLTRRTCLAALLVFASAVPGFAEHRARVSADLAGDLAAGSSSIDVIVHGDQATIDALASRYNLVIKRRMKSGAVLHVNAGGLDALQRDTDVDHLSGDRQLRASMAITNVAIGADQVWAGGKNIPSLTGAGIAVAVIDSGFDPKHNAIKGRTIATKDFTGGDGVDRYGHGTHVAGIIAGQAGRTSDTQHFQGVAAGAYLVNLRVLDENGGGVSSSVVEAIDWAIEHKQQYHIGVINLSLGGAVLESYQDDPMCEAVERAVRAGIVVVAAAGNFGTNLKGQTVLGSITSPGNSPYALTVGATDTHGTTKRSDDTVASYSSHGPTAYDLVIKPDLVAPGSHIVSAEAAGSFFSMAHPEHHVTGNGPNAYFQISGTSMSAGVVSGVAALLLQENGKLGPADVKAVVQLTSSLLPGEGLVTEGTGSLNALAAVQFVSNDFARLPSVSISGERVSPSGITTSPTATSIIWSSSDSIIWSSSNSIIWSSSDSIIWSS